MNFCSKHNYPPISINKLNIQRIHNTGKELKNTDLRKSTQFLSH